MHIPFLQVPRGWVQQFLLLRTGCFDAMIKFVELIGSGSGPLDEVLEGPVDGVDEVDKPAIPVQFGIIMDNLFEV